MKNLMPILFLCLHSMSPVAQGLESFAWLSGTWEMARPKGGIQLESWVEHNKATFIGKGLRVTGTDTTLLESLELMADKGYIWYVPTVPDQNEGKPIFFKLISSAKGQYTFENPLHDFPQRIVYRYMPLNIGNSGTSSPGDVLEVDVTDLHNEGIHFRFTRK